MCMVFRFYGTKRSYLLMMSISYSSIHESYCSYTMFAITFTTRKQKQVNCSINDHYMNIVHSFENDELD